LKGPAVLLVQPVAAVVVEAGYAQANRPCPELDRRQHKRDAIEVDKRPPAA